MRKYLFILCSHNSGSTALWKLLQTSQNVATLPLEGQFIGAVEPIMRKEPWDKAKVIPWPFVKAEWEKVWDPEKPILVEKSPPNLLHALAIEKNFEPSHFVVMVRSPYAYCEGTKRRGRSGLGYRKNAPYGSIAEGWIRECKYQIENIKKLENVIYFTYEEMTGNPSLITDKLLHFMPELKKLEIASPFSLHSLQGVVERPITNLNSEQIARLSAKDVAEINSVLKHHPDIMAFFGYEYLDEAYDLVSRTRFKLSSLYVAYFRRNIQRISRRVRHLRAVRGS